MLSTKTHHTQQDIKAMKKVLVVGGSSGIGASLISTLQRDHEVINISRRPVAGVTSYELDVLTDELPDIDDLGAIVYCPGSINLKPINSLKVDQMMDDYRINVLGAVRVIQKYNRTLSRSDNASITLFSTVAADQGMAFHASVAAAKGAVEGLTLSLAAEFAPKIRVNAIAPTITDTPLASHLLRNEKMVEKMQERHPLKRILSADEVSSMAAYLISDSSRGISGQIMRIDAGMSSIRV